MNQKMNQIKSANKVLNHLGRKTYMLLLWQIVTANLVTFYQQVQTCKMIK